MQQNRAKSLFTGKKAYGNSRTFVTFFRLEYFSVARRKYIGKNWAKTFDITRVFLPYPKSRCVKKCSKQLRQSTSKNSPVNVLASHAQHANTEGDQYCSTSHNTQFRRTRRWAQFDTLTMLKANYNRNHTLHCLPVHAYTEATPWAAS